MMRPYYTDLRLYRISDQNYYTFRLKIMAESLGGMEAQLLAFEMGAKLAGAGKLILSGVGIDWPMSEDISRYVELGDPNLLMELQYFLGQRRDRRHKPIEPKKVENENGLQGPSSEPEAG